MQLRSRIRRHRGQVVYLAILGLGLWLRWPVLGASLTLDDWDQYAMQQGIYPVKVHPLDMFNFVPGEPAARRALLEQGRLPWFAAPNLQLNVLRPLSSALVYLDYAWLDAQHHLFRIHFHSLLWWLGLIAVAGAIFYCTLPLPAAAAALLIYTIDDVHTWPLAWAANRSQIIANMFVFAALWANIRASEGAHRMRWLAYLLCGVGLLAGEHALPPMAYLLAFELVGTASALTTRIKRAAPWLALGAGYVAVHTALGYGAVGSSVYRSPTANLQHYIAVTGERLARLLAELGLSIPAEWWIPWPGQELVQAGLRVLHEHGWEVDGFQLQVALGAAIGLVAAGVSVWLLRRRPGSVAWLFSGALLSLLPLTATAAMTRLNVAPALGFAAFYGWSAATLARQLSATSQPLKRAASALALVALAYLYVAYPSRRSYGEGYFMGSVIGEQPLAAAKRLTDFGVPDVGGRHIFIVDSTDVTVQGSLMFMLHLEQRPLPKSIEILSPAIASPHLLERTASQVLDMRFPNGVIERPFTESIYHSVDQPFHAGQLLHCARFDVLIVAVEHGEPSHLRFIFPAPLEDPRYLWMAPRKSPPGIAPFQPPAVGASLLLPAALSAQ